MSNEVVMKIKTFTYKRILSLGNYESKHLEATIEVDTHLQDYAEEECSELMEMVEHKIREDAADKIKKEIRELKEELRNIQLERQNLIDQIQEVVNPDSTENEPDPDDIPFDRSTSEGGDF
jgi:thiamine pyrophosphate-dependent acetolactate synthase large subunit-like protein